MKAPLISLNEDFKWKLLSEILNVFDLRSCRKYNVLSKYEPNQCTYLVFELLNDLCPKRKKESRSIIIDSRDIDLNLNFHAKKITKESLENGKYKCGHSTHRSFFIGMKLTLALDSKTLKPLVFLINETNVSESKIYPKILEELKRKRIIKA